MEPTEADKNKIVSRATELESGAVPLENGGMVLGLPKPDIMTQEHLNSSSMKWSLDELLSQKKLIKDIEINSGASWANGTEIYSFTHTFSNVFDMHFRNMINLFRLYSWRLHFHLEFRSNFQQVGQIIVCQHNIPSSVVGLLTGQPPKDYLMKSYEAITMLPHQKIPMGEDVDCNVVMNWECPITATQSTPNAYKYLYMKATNTLLEALNYDMGTMAIVIGQQMQVATGVHDTMTVRIWSYLTDLKYGAYDPDDKIL